MSVLKNLSGAGKRRVAVLHLLTTFQLYSLANRNISVTHSSASSAFHLHKSSSITVSNMASVKTKNCLVSQVFLVLKLIWMCLTVLFVEFVNSEGTDFVQVNF